MLTYWSIANFKSIGQKPVRVELPGMTILVGANSSGKSSIIQSILATVQSYRSRGSAFRPLILNGEYVRLGALADVLNEAHTDAPLNLTFGITVPADLAEMTPGQPREFHVSAVLAPAVRMTADKEQQELQVAASSIYSVSDDSRVEWMAINRRPGHTRLWQRLKKQGPVRPIPLPPVEYIVRTPLPLLSEGIFGPLPQSEAARDAEPISVELDRFIPVAILAVVRPELQVLGRLNELATMVRGLNKLPSKTIRNFIAGQTAEMPGREEFEALITAMGKKTRLGWATEQLTMARSKAVERRDDLTLALQRFQIPEPAGATARSIRASLAEGVRYLGPLREDPRAVYDLPGTASTTDVGTKGQYTAAVLHANRTQRVTYIDPSSGALRRQPLPEAVRFWLREMRVIDEFETSEAGKLGYNLLVRARDSESFVDLTSVGVGVSQVLPILVQTLLAPDRSLVILEQPELHLHPAVQAHLADFILSAQMSGKKVLVETHSDHFMNRLRLRAADGRLKSPEASLRVYFVTRTDGVTEANVVPVNERGAWTEWPPGFMDHTTVEAEKLLRASLAQGRGG